MPALLLLLGAAGMLAQEPTKLDADCTGIDSPRCQVQRFLYSRLTLWQSHLGLEEWQISIVLTRRDGLKARTLGGIHWDKKKKTAVLAVLDPSEYRLGQDEMLRDMEFTLVHELVHLELASLPRSEASRSNEEHAVNRLTEALLKLSRAR